MVTFTDSDDRRSAYLRNKAIQNANTVRERRATVENPQWAMSRDADWYQNRDNLSSIKGTLANMPAVTTDQGEGRNMYQMLMNQMKGGDRGARLIDTSGLPAGARRTGRTLFTDPAKSQGFLGDVGSLFTGKNKAAVRAREYNPFPKAGFGKDWYKDQFPIASGLGSLMEGAENFIPGIGMAKRMLTREREPLERDLSYAPNPYDELPMMEFEDDTETIAETPLGAADRSDPLPLENWFYTPPFDDEVSITDLPIDEDITETITEDDGKKFVLKEANFPQGNLGWMDPVTMEENYDYNPLWDLNIMNIQDYELKKKATDAAIQFNNLWKSKKGKEDKSDMYELETLYEKYMDAVEAGAQTSLEDINFEYDEILEDKADVLNDLEEIKRERKDIDQEGEDLGLWYNI